MSKIFIILILSLFLKGCAYHDDGKVISYGDSHEMPEKARPNAATISLYEIRKKTFIDNRRRQGELYIVKPKGNATKFTYENNLPSSKLEKELSEGYLLSYLYYDNGIIKYDGFRKNVTNETLFFTHSTGKSITSYIVGHAICDGFISSIDEIIDWPLMKNTLYQGQPLRNLLNMSAGDSHVVDKNSTRFMGSSEHHRNMGLDTIAYLLDGTKAKGQAVFYNNALSDIIANYIVFKTGDKYDDLMKKIFQDKIKIENEVSYQKHSQSRLHKKNPEYNGSPQTLASYSYYMTRLDFLRVAEAMMKDYQNKTCVGNYLRESQQQAKNWPKYNPSGDNAWFRFHNNAYQYGSQFYFNFSGMSKRNIIGTEGLNGQIMLIDLDNSKIVITNSAVRGWDVKTLVLNVIKKGKLPN